MSSTFIVEMHSLALSRSLLLWHAPETIRRCTAVALSPAYRPCQNRSIAVPAITLRDKAMSEYGHAQLEHGDIVACRMKLISALLTKLIHANVKDKVRLTMPTV